MRCLGIETSGKTGSVAAFGDDVATERVFPRGTSHGRGLALETGRLLDRLGWALEQLEVIAVSLGPGSYTGLRIGAAYAKALSFATAVPLVGVPTFHAMVLSGPPGHDLLAPVLDARWNQAYAALFARQGRQWTRRLPDAVGAPDALFARFPDGTCFFGPGTASFRATLEPRGVVADPGPWDRASALDVARLGAEIFADTGAADPGSLHPIYLRKSQPEEKRAARAENR